MKPRRKWNTPLTWPTLLAVLSLSCALLFAWITALAPHLMRTIKPLKEAYPYAYAILYALIGFGVLPFSLGPPGIALCLYQRRWDKSHSQPSASPNGGPATPLGNSGVREGPPSVS